MEKPGPREGKILGECAKAPRWQDGTLSSSVAWWYCPPKILEVKISVKTVGLGDNFKMLSNRVRK